MLRTTSAAPGAFKAALVLLVALAAPFVLAGTAIANNAYQDGYYQTNGVCCSGAAMDGWRADIKASTDAAAAQACVLTDVLAGDHIISDVYQLESGVAKCGSSFTLDTGCVSSGAMDLYVEYHDMSGYSCYNHGSTTTSATNTIRVTESYQYSCSTYFASYINGTKYSDYFVENNCNENDWFGMAWAEITTAVTCNQYDHLYADYSNIARYEYGVDDFQPVNSVSSYSSGGSCFTRSSYSGQDFKETLN